MRPRIKVELLTLRACEQVIGARAAEWEGRCYEVVTRLAEAWSLSPKGAAVYGHWTGPVDKRAIFFTPAAKLFVRHGWIALTDGRVLDPTRWAFEGRAIYPGGVRGVKPYLYLGPADHYDEGGNRFRAAMRVREPPPQWDPDERAFEITESVLDSEAWVWAENYLGLVYGDFGQLFYLANAPLDDLGKHASAVYRALTKLGQQALIPIDNLARVKSGRWP